MASDRCEQPRATISKVPQAQAYLHMTTRDCLITTAQINIDIGSVIDIGTLGAESLIDAGQSFTCSHCRSDLN